MNYHSDVREITNYVFRRSSATKPVNRIARRATITEFTALTDPDHVNWESIGVFPREDKGDREGIPHTHPIP